MSNPIRLFSYKNHWLDSRGGVFYVGWLDRIARQSRRASLRTRDLSEAKDRLIAWVMEHAALEPGDPKSVTVAECLQHYHLKHGQYLLSAEQARIAGYQLIALLDAATVSEMTPDRQTKLIQQLRDSGKSSGTVSRVLSVLRAALKYEEKYQLLTRAPFIFDVTKGRPRERVMTVDELRAIFTHAPPHLQMFIVLAIGTGARRGALLELTRFQCDTERRLIHLNPPDRDQNNKRRPTLPMVPALLPWIESAKRGHLIEYHDQPVASIRTAWRDAREKAELGKDVTPNTIRHTVATELRAAGVDEAQCAGFLGHRWSNSTTEGYAKYRPDFLSGAAAVVNRLISEVAGPGRPATSGNPLARAYQVRTSGLAPGVPTKEEARHRVVGATGIEPVTPTMST